MLVPPSRRLLPPCVLALAVLLLPLHSAFAQQVDLEKLLQRLEKLEQKNEHLEKQNQSLQLQMQQLRAGSSPDDSINLPAATVSKIASDYLKQKEGQLVVRNQTKSRYRSYPISGRRRSQAMPSLCF